MTRPTRKVAASENSAIAAERLRVAAILESAEGKRNPAMAQKLALYSVLDAETAIGILADAPSANPYLEAMSVQGPIGLGGAAVEVSNDPKAARLREIRQSVATFNTEKGWTKPARDGSQ